MYTDAVCREVMDKEITGRLVEKTLVITAQNASFFVVFSPEVWKVCFGSCFGCFTYLCSCYGYTCMRTLWSRLLASVCLTSGVAWSCCTRGRVNLSFWIFRGRLSCGAVGSCPVLSSKGETVLVSSFFLLWQLSWLLCLMLSVVFLPPHLLWDIIII